MGVSEGVVTTEVCRWWMDSETSEHVLTGKDVLQDLSEAKSDDVVFLNAPEDDKGGLMSL